MDVILLQKLINGGRLLPSHLNIKVTVVGAGFSGLFCGWLLNRFGFKVKVYEASDRIGGRVSTVTRQNRLIEAGGEFIGSNHPIWLLLAKHFGLELESLPESKLHESIMISDRNLTPEQVKIVNEQVQEIYMRISEDATKVTNSDQPWNDSLEVQRLDHISIKDKLDEWGICGDVRSVVEFYLSNDNVASIDKQSYLGLLCQVKGGAINADTRTFWDATEMFRCANGNQTLATALSESLNIKKNHPVTGITYANTHIGHISTYTSHGEMYKLQGNSYHVSDFIVLAVPPTTWKYIKFYNALDLANYTPDMGPAIKIVNYSHDRFWEKEGLAPNTIITDVGQTWEQTENHEESLFSLALFAGGSQVANKDKVANRLNEIFNGKFSDAVHHSEIFNWPEIPNIGIGYSYIGLGKGTSVNKLLYEPVPSYGNKLLFAGEHTSMSFCGFMEGALQSGFRATLKIIEQVERMHNITLINS